jgi:ribosomal protein L11 methyltransferase
MPLFKLSFGPAPFAAASSGADHLAELSAPHALAVTLFESGPESFVVEAYYGAKPALADLVGAQLSPLSRLPAPVLAGVPDQDWVALSQAALPPVAAGRFLVHARHDRGRARPRRTAIEIEAGQAFGTAHNATTALCLEAIDRLVRRRRFTSVLDLGCGTGVLAIAAAQAMAGALVVAVDSDPVATATARTNVRLNSMGQRVRVLDATGFAHPRLRTPRHFDLVLANLLPGPLIDLAPAMRRALRPHGVAVLSGLLDHQARELAATYRALGFGLVAHAHRAGWSVLMLARAADRGAKVRGRS